MPFVNIETWGMDEQKKTKLIKVITGVFVSIGIPAQAVTVIIHESHKENGGTAGEQIL